MLPNTIMLSTSSSFKRSNYVILCKKVKVDFSYEEFKKHMLSIYGRTWGIWRKGVVHSGGDEVLLCAN